ncbi:MAG: LysM peptidoglycan-binding domain-containing protein [Microscillaceae bacterium]|nr:LysM peptidoglycan-binding domain-containing protein [Microscillaceae bacterium]
MEALRQLRQRTAQFAISAEVAVRIAQVYYQQGSGYNPQTGLYREKYQQAFALCEEIIQQYPQSIGAQQALALQAQITEKSLDLELQENLPANLVAPVLVKYRNLDQIYWKVCRTDEKERERIEEIARKSQNSSFQQELIRFYAAKAAVKTWDTALPPMEDYYLHRVEEKFPALAYGEYVVLVSDGPDFSYEGYSVNYAFFQVSDLSYLQRGDEEGNIEFYVLHRVSGQPIAGVTATVQSQEYNYQTRRYETLKIGDFVSDGEGFFRVPYQGSERRRNSLKVTFRKGEDFLNPAQSYSQYRNNREPEPPRPQAYFFTDRAIYRPGQTLYFKAVVLEKEAKNARVLPETGVKVNLYDVNGQEVAELRLKSNEFGTVHGQFVLPNTGLNGEMRLEAVLASEVQDLQHTVAQNENLYRIARRYGLTVEQIKAWNNLKDDKLSPGQVLKIVAAPREQRLGSTSFSVEDYKRPKFEVSFEPVKGTFRLRDEISMEGKAMAYSGASLDGAEVRYRVVRKARFPYWWYYRWGYYPSSPEMEITSGMTQTNQEGKFTVKFPALPDENTSPASSPVFTYTVYADVTDLNGETHSAQGSASVGYQALEISASMPNEWNPNEKVQINLNTQNLNGQFEPARGKISIVRLQGPSKAYRARLWEQPDQFNYSESEWHRDLPQDLYKNEDQISQWPLAAEMLTQSFDTEKEKQLTLENLRNWPAGQYRLEMSATDKFGQEVKSVHTFLLASANGKSLPIPQIDFFVVKKSQAEPGEKVAIQLGSSENVRALVEIEHEGRILQKQWVSLNGPLQTLEFPVKEEFRGNFGLHYTFFKDNRGYAHSHTFQVPYTNKQLDIQFESFRDKLQPGEKETWRLKISGKNGDKIAAEMVATLYDASLDAFRTHSFGFNLLDYYYTRLSWRLDGNFNTTDFRQYQENWNPAVGSTSVEYDALEWFGMLYNFGNQYYPVMATYSGLARRERSTAYEEAEMAMDESEDVRKVAAVPPPAPGLALKPTSAELAPEPEAETDKDLGGVKARTNFNETAFFYPTLRTDAEGRIIVEFTIPEALTRWKMMGFAHSQDLKTGSAFNELLTQKELMVVPNASPFFRENDRVVFATKISSLADKDLEGTAQLLLFNPLTNQPIDMELGNTSAQKPFKVGAGQSTALRWEIQIPEGLPALTYRVVAKSGRFSDGEEMSLPVLTNRMLVTETMPLPVRGQQTKTYTLAKLAEGPASSTLKNHRYTLEFTANPAWYAVQALPYMMEYPYECAEQVFSRLYANALAAHIANSSPKIKAVFEEWRTLSAEALLSNLDKNQELKSLVIEETPWLLNANDEGERKRQIGVLFDLNRMAGELNRAIQKLREKQVASGAWTWFEGMREDRYLTQHIVTGLGHLDHLGLKIVRENAEVKQMLERALRYLDREVLETYQDLLRRVRQGKTKLEDQHIGYYEIQYLYARSFFADVPMDKDLKEALEYYKAQAKKYWNNFNQYLQGMMALGLHRFGDTQTPAAIVKSFREKALLSDEMGMYWKNQAGYYWYEAPIETQALMIEVFDEVAQDAKAVDELKTWLLKQKQTQDWKTTKATAEACYALLLRGENWLAADQPVEITVGSQKINPLSEANVSPVEAGTGYFKMAWNGPEITPEMGRVTVSKPGPGVAWGAIYWQYFEQLDKITPAATPLSLKKQLFIEKNSDRGPVLTPITEATPLKVGDLVKVRIELRVDRMMEYVHMKDMRAAGFEPVNVISRYKYQDGLGYYESTRDAATNFFIGYLPKGTYVFEYPLRVNQAGDFSNGITTIQAMYAPEFASHSEGIRVKVVE